MRSYLLKRWFLVSLFVLITAGLALGAGGGRAVVEGLNLLIRPRMVTATVLFLMAFSLDSGQLKKSLQSPGPVVLAFVLNFGMIPLLCWALMPLQLSPDFQIGLMIAASVPCTMAAASVWTRKAGGNDAVSLLVTVSTNGLCFLITPFWLNLTTTGNVQLDFWQMFWRLMFAVLVPTLLGQTARQLPSAAKFATKHKPVLGAVAQIFILTIVFSAACRAGVELGNSGPKPSAAGVAIVWGSCVAVHIAVMAMGIAGSRLAGFSRSDCIAVAFSSSQKTLPIGVLLATDPTMFGNPNLLGTGTGIGIPFAVFPMLMFHASQLFIDTAVADRFATRGEKPETAPEPTVSETDRPTEPNDVGPRS